MRTKSKLKIKKVRNFIFNNTEYSIVWKKKPFKKWNSHQAEVESPDDTNPKMRIAPETYRNDSLKLLKALLDESFHVFQFHVDNDFVDKYSEQVGQFLHDIGYHVDIKD